MTVYIVALMAGNILSLVALVFLLSFIVWVGLL